MTLWCNRISSIERGCSSNSWLEMKELPSMTCPSPMLRPSKKSKIETVIIRLRRFTREALGKLLWLSASKGAECKHKRRTESNNRINNIITRICTPMSLMANSSSTRVRIETRVPLRTKKSTIPMQPFNNGNRKVSSRRLIMAQILPQVSLATSTSANSIMNSRPETQACG